MSKKTDWGKVIRETINDVVCIIRTTPSKPKQPVCPNQAARVCILVLMGVTLLFSGIGIFSWIILIMLFIISRFV